MYKLIQETPQKQISSVKKGDLTFIPFDPLNTDYQQFKTDISDGVELQDPDGNKLTKAKVTAFLKTLP